ncbi:TsoY family (seleno)protein [Aliiroseovarius sp. 2305UL8-7]|uniref:TsoY family (seleno)protein n=1 Tax=Aliiroseovarius conchicola TaxID=3121637 RepID=UPI0035277078
MQPNRPADKYSPLYFLASVGVGGLSVTFFMYLMFWVKHPGRPVPVFEDIIAAFTSGSMGLQIAIAIAWIGIATFVFLNLKYLFWNLKAFSGFRKSETYEKLKNSNGETTILAMPLAMAMSVNGLFIAGLVFVPGLWPIVEYLFPFAMAAFLAIGIYALSLIGDFLGRVLSKGGVFDVTAHNSFAQMLPSFALAMTAVGFAAPAAMSHNTIVVGVSLVGSTFFGIAAIVYAALALFTAFNSMLHYGTAKEAAPTLMIVIPLMTILGIMFMRQNHGLHATFDVHGSAAETMIFLARLIAVQVLFGLLGMTVLSRVGYWKSYVFGSEASPGSYALVCPGVALSVLLQFFVNSGLVKAGVLDKFSVTYWAITAIAIAFQFGMVALVFRLNKQHFGRAEQTVVPAE